MRVDVDEPGRDDLTVRVNRARGRLVDLRCELRDDVAANREISSEPRIAGAVDDASVLDQQVVGSGLRSRHTDDRESTEEDEGDQHTKPHAAILQPSARRRSDPDLGPRTSD